MFIPMIPLPYSKSYISDQLKWQRRGIFVSHSLLAVSLSINYNFYRSKSTISSLSSDFSKKIPVLYSFSSVFYAKMNFSCSIKNCIPHSHETVSFTCVFVRAFDQSRSLCCYCLFVAYTLFLQVIQTTSKQKLNT